MRFAMMGRDRGAALGLRTFGLVVAVGGARRAAARVRVAGRSGSAARSAEVAFIRSDNWRYYGFSDGTPEADASVVAPACVADALAIGSIVSTLPDDCFVTVVNGHAYRRCGHVWFQPQYTGSNVTYVVVDAP
jgi:hypothetical protein